jgi:hypothetical protein
VRDEQWKKITEHLKLPDAARGEIEREIIWYVEICSTWHRPPSEVGKRLDQVSAAASRLAALLERLEERERLELAEVWPADTTRLSTLGRVDQAILDAKSVSIICKTAREQISKLNQPTRVDELIERLDSILHQFSDVGVSQAQAVMTFLVEVFKAAGIKLKERSIRLAVERFHARGKKRKKEFSKSATDSRR